MVEMMPNADMCWIRSSSHHKRTTVVWSFPSAFEKEKRFVLARAMKIWTVCHVARHDTKTKLDLWEVAVSVRRGEMLDEQRPGFLLD
jgi:hypothetical protein